MRQPAPALAFLTLVALLAAAVPAWAETITLPRTQPAGKERRAGGPASDVRLRVAVGGQQPGASLSLQQEPGGAGGQTSQVGSLATVAAPDVVTAGGGPQIETISVGDVTGTVCDCGEVPPVVLPPVVVFAFPWWTFAGVPLAGLPLLFDDDDSPPPSVTQPTPPGPTPPPTTPIPEPATLLLFGTGLLAAGARAHRRRAGRRLSATHAAAPGEEA